MSRTDRIKDVTLCNLGFGQRSQGTWAYETKSREAYCEIVLQTTEYIVRWVGNHSLVKCQMLSIGYVNL